MTDGLAELARITWLVAGRSVRLHAPVDAVYDDVEWLVLDVTFACGRTAEAAYVPGLFSRMGAERCSRCCDSVGLPRGVGSPKNDAACRVLLGLTSEGDGDD